MSYKIITIAKFERELKRLTKKYPSLKAEYIELLQKLKKEPALGTPIGHQCYKIRLAIASKGKGKSGGARVITYIQILQTTIYLLTIYDKSEQGNIPDSDILQLLKTI